MQKKETYDYFRFFIYYAMIRELYSLSEDKNVKKKFVLVYSESTEKICRLNIRNFIESAYSFHLQCNF